MSERYCQNPTCHTRNTFSRIRGVKGAKVLRTKKITTKYDYTKYLNYFCDYTCMINWLNKNIERCVLTLGLITKPSETPIDIVNEERKDYYGNDYTRKIVVPLLNSSIKSFSVTHSHSSMSAIIIHPSVIVFQQLFFISLCANSFCILLEDHDITLHPSDVAISTELSVDSLS